MAYPQPSSWMSPDEGSAWFFKITPTRQICSTTGWDGLLDIQSALRDRLATAGPLPTWDSTMVSDRDVPDGGGWDLRLLRALYAVAQLDMQAVSSPAVQVAYLNDVQGSAIGQAIREKTLALALWITYVSHSFAADGSDIFGNGTPEQVTFPAGQLQLPVFGASVPQPARQTSVTGVRCTPAEPYAGSVFFTPERLLVAGIIVLGTYGMLNLSKKFEIKRHR